MPVVSLKTPFVKRNVTHRIETELSELLDTPVKVEQADLKWFNRLSLKNVSVDDKIGGNILKANNITAGLKILPLIKGDIELSTIRLFGFNCHITKETSKSPMNIQHIIDKLSGNGNNDNKISLKINSILIRQGNIKYDILNKAYTNHKFNPNHININNLNGKIAFDLYKKDSINLRIKKLSFEEISGFKVNKLSTNITGKTDSIRIEKFRLDLPKSSIKIPEANIKLNMDSTSKSFNQSLVALNLKDSKITPSDLTEFVPFLENFNDAVNLNADISGQVNDLHISKIVLKCNKYLTFDGNLYLKNIAEKDDKLYISGQVKNLDITADGLNKLSNNFSKMDITLPEQVMKLNTIKFNGEISGYTNNLVASGNMQTSVGDLQMDMTVANNNSADTTMLLTGNISSTSLNIKELFKEGNPYGTARFSAKVDLAKPLHKKTEGFINAQINEFEYKGYNYNNIILSGVLKNNKYEGTAEMDDSNGKIRMQGLFENKGKESIINITANVKNLHPDKLHIINKYEKPDISFEANANFSGNNVDNFEGSISLSNLDFHTKTDSFSIKYARIESVNDELPERRIVLKSDIINGEIKGQYNFKSLAENLYQTTANYLPSLISTIKTDSTDKENIFDIWLSVGNTENISKTLKLPITIYENATFRGHYNSLNNEIDAEATLPKFDLGKSTFSDGSLMIENPSDKIELKLNATQTNKKNVHNIINLLSDISEDHINTKIHWNNDKEEKFNAEIEAVTLFTIDEGNGQKKLRTEITIPASQIMLKDSIWNIEPSSVTIANKKIDIDNFFITKANQHLRINGNISNNPKDVLMIDLNDIELTYLFDLINIEALDFGGMATGLVKGRDLTGSVMLDCQLDVKDFSFNDAVQGRLKLSGEWDNDEQGILLLGTIYKDDTTYTDINGYIYPIGKRQGLSLYFDANDINVALAQKYLKTFASDIGGRGYGNVRIYGDFSKINIEGSPCIKDGNIKLNLLNTAYSFSDTIHIKPGSIGFKNIDIADKDGNKGKLNLLFTHDYFKNLHYDINVNADKIMLYNITERMNPTMYGKAYASGMGEIKGTEDYIIVNGNLRSEAGTSIGFNMLENTTAENYDFITFKQKETEKKDDNIKEKNNDSSIDYQLNFSINATPEANIEFITDPIAGDKLKGNGNGNLQVQYGKKNDLQIYGNYLINNGTYNFSLQQVIHKLFRLREGSSISFHGDPMKAQLNIGATYYLTANIQDLDESLILETANYSSVPINCILNINGLLQNPNVGFDLDFPSSSNELERKVKSFIDTEDMMTRQIIYLLVLNKFYTPDYSSNTYRSNELSAVASSALSTQLSNILSSLTDKVQIGTNIRSRQDGIKDTEVEMLLSSQLLNNRLIFNGNFGYKDNYIQSNAFIGEFDLEYKLNRTGEIRLKAYNHANDMYRYNTKSLTRQGVGIMFKKDFSNLYDLFKTKKTKNDKTSETQK